VGIGIEANVAFPSVQTRRILVALVALADRKFEVRKEGLTLFVTGNRFDWSYQLWRGGRLLITIEEPWTAIRYSVSVDWSVVMVGYLAGPDRMFR
jgi:hypothetical protein